MVPTLEGGALSSSWCSYGGSCIGFEGVEAVCMHGVRCEYAPPLYGRPQPPQGVGSVGDIDVTYACLDFALMCGVIQGKVAPDQIKPYTDQVTDFTAPTPLVVATLLTSKSLQFSTTARKTPALGARHATLVATCSAAAPATSSTTTRLAACRRSG